MERQSLKYSVNKLVFYILYYCAGPGCLICYCKLCGFLSRVSYLSLFSFARVAVVFLVESYKTVIERRSYCAGPGCLIYYCKLCCFLSRVSYLSLFSFARVAVVFFVESYKTVIERRSYVSFINIIKLFDLPV